MANELKNQSSTSMADELNKATNRNATSLHLPSTLKQQLTSFRERVWKTKMTEVTARAITGVGFGFLVLFLSDRLFDTPQIVRLGIFAGVVSLWCLVAYAYQRWVVRYRRLDELARLLRQKDKVIGESLLGVIELSESSSEQNRSPALCAAAMEQVAAQAAKRDLNIAAPVSHHRRWSLVAGSFAVIVLGLLTVFPGASINAAIRLLAPLIRFDRYTFAKVESLAEALVVPHGEEYLFRASLKAQTEWSPKEAQLTLANQPPLKTQLNDRAYQFVLPSLHDTTSVNVRVGDYRHTMTVQPKMRPEVEAIHAEIELPKYLQIPASVKKDLRGGSFTAVEGSSVRISARINRDIDQAEARLISENGNIGVVEVVKKNDLIVTNAISVLDQNPRLDMTWVDKDGLGAASPTQIRITAIPDLPPVVASEDFPRQAVVLNEEQINFHILANDDFGVKRVGLQWRSKSNGDQQSSENSWRNEESLANHSSVLALGGPDKSNLDALGVFRPADLGIESEMIEVRLWADDYRPDRPRSYSVPYMLYVLTSDEHALWITDQLSKWHRQSLDIRDREIQLYQSNKQLRALNEEELSDPKNQKRIEDQASAEASNARRLSSLTKTGEGLLRQAARNPSMGVGHLERWAEMLQTLEDIGDQRMPKVTDLLRKAAEDTAQSQSSSKPKPSGPAVGNIRNTTSGPSEKTEEVKSNDPPKPPAPAIADTESSQQPADFVASTEDEKTKKKNPSSGRLTLPQTTLVGPAQKPTENKDEEPKPDNAMAPAVEAQADLLAEFDKIADELNKVLGELEGTTLVKRLKAASREQNKVAQEISQRLESVLGNAPIAKRNESLDHFKKLAEVEAKNSQKISNIIDDLDAFFERRKTANFQQVLKEMKDSQVAGSIRQLGDEIVKEQGLSIAQAEYWSDTLDRWAEDIVDPAGKGSCPGCKNSNSLPPSVVLEVLQVLEGQMNLREETRVAEQSKLAHSEEEHKTIALRLAEKQVEFHDRIAAVVDKIEELPEGSKKFEKEITLLDKASALMVDSKNILSTPETGKPSMAIQTEIIELLLQSKRINPKSKGGGGGSSPGGGGSGDTQDAAIALIGAGLNSKENRQPREVNQATGTTGSSLPEEFRSGLNEYFNKIESQPRTQP